MTRCTRGPTSSRFSARRWATRRWSKPSRPRRSKPARVGAHHGAGLDVGRHEAAERVGRQVGHDLQADPSRAPTAHLDGHEHQRFGAGLAPAAPAGFDPADVAVVDLNLAPPRLPLRRHHRPAQLVQHHPSGPVARQAELALRLAGRDARGGRGHQVGGPEPQGARGTGGVKHRAGGDRRLVAAGPARPPRPPLEHEGLAVPAPRAAVAVGPAARDPVGPASGVVGEAVLELDDRLGEVRSGQAGRLRRSEPDKHERRYCLRSVPPAAAGAPRRSCGGRTRREPRRHRRYPGRVPAVRMSPSTRGSAAP